MAAPETEDLLSRIEQLNDIGIALSAEHDTPRLLEQIIEGAMSITRADGGSVYSLTDGRTRLELAIMRTRSLGLAMGGTTGEKVPFEPIPLYDEDGEPILRTVATCSIHQGRTINVPDAYSNETFDFTGTRDFDRVTGYRSRSFLTIPLRDHEKELIGVLQLINAVDDASGRVIPFSTSDQRLAESLASQAAVTLTTKRLIADLQTLFDSVVRMIATTIDEKSPHTGSHCRRVPPLTMMLAEAAHRTEEGPLRDYRLTEEDRYALDVAAWLHDCGKLTTPDHVMEKSTKLETVFDRIELVDARLEILRRDSEIRVLRQALATSLDGKRPDLAEVEREHASEVGELERIRALLHRCNRPAEITSESDQEDIRRIARTPWRRFDGTEMPLLADEEEAGLRVSRGTLTPIEREIMRNHITASIKMLESLPFPRHLRNVPEFAGAHHERMDGRGYPRGLRRDQMSIPARILAIADIFEALTATTRPYKKGLTVRGALEIMERMAVEGHIDPDLFEVFVREKVHEEFAAAFLEEAALET
jgi:HD-GYP domain-containing protein (c-di-GMP phosphodiesterase class II)